MAKRPTKYNFVETHEHPEGGDRGGFAPETHTFRVYEDGSVDHDYQLKCNDSGPGGFGLDNGTLERLETKEDALSFVRERISELKAKLAGFEQCLASLESATSYKDVADYSHYDEENEDEDVGDEED